MSNNHATKVKLVLKPLLDQLAISNKKVRSKAEQYMLTLDFRAPSGLHGPLNTCKYAVCVHIACRQFGEFFDRDNALKIVASDPKTYQQAYTTVSNILGVWAEVSFTELGIHLGCPQVAPVAEKVIGKYRERFLSGLSEAKRKMTNFNKLVFTAVAFYLSAEFMKVKIDKEAVMKLTDTTSDDFNAIYSSMSELIIAPLHKKQRDEAARAKVEQMERAKQGLSRTTDEEDDNSGDYAAYTGSGYTKRRKLVETPVEADAAMSSIGEPPNADDEFTAQMESARNASKKSRTKPMLASDAFADEKVNPDASAQFEETRSSINEVLNTSAINMEDDVFANDLRQVEGIVEKENLAREEALRKRKREEYEEWRNKILSEKLELPKAPTKQTTLSFGSKVSETAAESTTK